MLVVAEHGPVAVLGEEPRRADAQEREALPVPAAARTRLLPPAEDPTPRRQAAEPSH